MSIKYFIGIVVSLTLSLGCVNKGDGTGFNSEDYEETKMTLEEQEKSSPLDFIEIKFSYRKNMWGTFLMNGSIKNNATVATYKEPVIRFSFYSKTGRHLGDRDRVWDEFLPPGKSLQVEYRETNMSNATEVRVDIIKAQPQ
ncbi:hypothetical protein N9Y60_00045 [Crocinitomicaceae bacterium]|nr:hypothetical protein [Crocinitomicaceae bacterium]MDB3906598.1 hypothetical protein [Crocinitomicaceae bacterium]